MQTQYPFVTFTFRHYHKAALGFITMLTMLSLGLHIQRRPNSHWDRTHLISGVDRNFSVHRKRNQNTEQNTKLSPEQHDCFVTVSTCSQEYRYEFSGGNSVAPATFFWTPSTNISTFHLLYSRHLYPYIQNYKKAVIIMSNFIRGSGKKEPKYICKVLSTVSEVEQIT